MYNMLSNWLKNNAEDVDLIVNFLVIAIPIVLVNMEGFISPLISSVLVIVLGVANVYSSRVRRNKLEETDSVDEGA